MKKPIRFRLNGRPTTLDTDGDRSLLQVLRNDLGLTGAKYGCGVSLCGACTVVVDGEAVRSCQTPLSAVRDAEVVTVEGLADDETLHPLQRAFLDHGGYQCGYCTPGMLMSAYALLRANPRPTRREIVAGLEDNLCRCSAYRRILAAVQDAVDRESTEMGGAS